MRTPPPKVWQAFIPPSLTKLRVSVEVEQSGGQHHQGKENALGKSLPGANTRCLHAVPGWGVLDLHGCIGCHRRESSVVTFLLRYIASILKVITFCSSLPGQA